MNALVSAALRCGAQGARVRVSRVCSIEQAPAAWPASFTATPLAKAWLLGDGLYAKSAGDGRGDQPQQRIAETGDHDPQHGKADTERDGTVGRTDRHRGQA